MTSPVLAGPLTLAAYLAKVLDTIVGVFEQEGVDLPSRRYWTTGGVVADCEQLTVHVTQIYKGLPGEDPGQPQRCESPRTAAMTVQLFRPVPTGSGTRPPSSEIMMRSSEHIARDAELLLDSADAISAAAWGTGIIAEVNIGAPSGGLIGLTMMVSAPYG